MKKSLNNNLNEYWNQVGTNYGKQWQFFAKEFVNNQEKSLVVSNAKKYSNQNVLDIGVGNGRILQALAQSGQNLNLFGVDVSEQMLTISQQLVPSAELKIADVSLLDLPFSQNFDLITVVRVFQYFNNWEQVLAFLATKLNSGGRIVFSLPNSNSVNVFRPSTGNSFHRANYNQVKTAVNSSGLALESVSSFSKLPEKLYEVSNNKIYVKSLLLIESVLKKLLGNIGGKVLFYTVYKK